MKGGNIESVYAEVVAIDCRNREKCAVKLEPSLLQRLRHFTPSAVTAKKWSGNDLKVLNSVIITRLDLGVTKSMA